jgi:hypothetical protein
VITDRGGSPRQEHDNESLRYFFGMGRSEFTRVFYSYGPKGLVGPENVAFVEMFAVAHELPASKKGLWIWGTTH